MESSITYSTHLEVEYFHQIHFQHLIPALSEHPRLFPSLTFPLPPSTSVSQDVGINGKIGIYCNITKLVMSYHLEQLRSL